MNHQSEPSQGKNDNMLCFETIIFLSKLQYMTVVVSSYHSDYVVLCVSISAEQSFRGALLFLGVTALIF